MPFNPSKVINRIKSSTSITKDSIIIRDSTSVEFITPYKEFILTSSSLNIEEVQAANAALLSEISMNDCLSTHARKYAACVVRRSEHSNVRNLILEEGQAKLTAAVTRRKAILSEKRKIVNEKHILTTSKIHDDLVKAKKRTKKRKAMRTKKDKREAIDVEQESIDESETSQNEELVILSCIEVKY